jgi:CBS domain-containing protein
MKARDIMTSDVEVVTPNDPVSRAAELMRDANVGIIPVVEDTSSMRLRGVITDRDIAVRHVAERHTQECRVGDHMTADRIDTVRPDSDLDEVVRVMERDQIRRVPVVEDGQRLVGIIAQADLAREAPAERVGELVERLSEPGGTAPGQMRR